MSVTKQIKVGTRVRAWGSWGEGVVVSNDSARRGPNPDTGRLERQKPLHVRRDGDSRIGYFHYDQVEEV